jgi:hypothetical protein
MRMFGGLALVVLSAFVSSSVMAATVQTSKGRVSINSGSGYQLVRGPTQANVGDLVMASPGSSAQIVYNAQCSVAVRPGQIMAIASEPPCHKTASFDPYGTRMNAGIYGGKGFEEPPRRRVPWVPILAVGALATVAGLCIGDVICDDDKPASP